VFGENKFVPVGIFLFFMLALFGVAAWNYNQQTSWRGATRQSILNATPDFTSCSSLGARDFACVQNGTLTLRVTCYNSDNESLYCDSNPLVKLK
jgi:hypothetical protein